MDIDPYTALDLLTNNTEREYLLSRISNSRNQKLVIRALETLKLNEEERLDMIESLYDDDLIIRLLKKNAFSEKERFYILENKPSMKVLDYFLNKVDNKTKKEEKIIVDELRINILVGLEMLITNKLSKMSKENIDYITTAIINSEPQTYLMKFPNSPRRAEAFDIIMKKGRTAVGFFVSDLPTKAEKRKLLEKIAESATSINMVLNGKGIHQKIITNHDKKYIAEIIVRDSNIPCAKLLSKCCRDKNVQAILEPLLTAAKLADL